MLFSRIALTILLSRYCSRLASITLVSTIFVNNERSVHYGIAVVLVEGQNAYAKVRHTSDTDFYGTRCTRKNITHIKACTSNRIINSPPIQRSAITAQIRRMLEQVSRFCSFTTNSSALFVEGTHNVFETGRLWWGCNFHLFRSVS